MKTEIPTYQARLMPGSLSIAKWQHRDSGGLFYEREYYSLRETENDLADKYGAKFAKQVVRELRNKGLSTNRQLQSL